MTRLRTHLTRTALSLIFEARSADARDEDRARLEAWAKQSKAHEAAQKEASSLFLAMAAAAHELEAEREERRVLQQFMPPRPAFSRRAILIGGFSGAAAAAAISVWPPLNLWPSLKEQLADYHTAKGQRRTVSLALHVQVDLNTRTSINVKKSADTTVIKLIDGEAVVSLAASEPMGGVRLIAENGFVHASKGSFAVRTGGKNVRAACLEGALTVVCGGREATLAAQSEISYSASGLGEATPSDVAALTAWRQGFLLFRNEPLARVIDEINRYRHGRVVLLDSALGQRRITARLKIDTIDEIFPHIHNTLGVSLKTLPGGIVLLG